MFKKLQVLFFVMVVAFGLMGCSSGSGGVDSIAFEEVLEGYDTYIFEYVDSNGVRCKEEITPKDVYGNGMIEGSDGIQYICEGYLINCTSNGGAVYINYKTGDVLIYDKAKVYLK